jgi:tetratricopeptide (TPR) repeat protein
LIGIYSPVSAAPPPDVQAWEQLMNGSVRALKSNQLDEAIAQCERALDMAGGFGERDTHRARSLVLRAEIFLWQKQHDRAEALFQSAVATCEKAVGPDDLEMVHPLTSLANYYYYVAVRYGNVAALFERILGIVEKAPGHDEHQTIMWRRNLGLIYQQMGRFEQAEPLFAKAVASAEKADPAWVPHELLTMAEFYRTWGKFEPAEAAAARALAIRESALAAAPDNVDAKLDLAVSLDALGAIYVSSKRGKEATKVCRRSLALVETFMTPDQPDLVPRLMGLAEALRADGSFAESDEMFQRALAVTEKNLGAVSREYTTLLKQYAGLLREAGKPDAAASAEARSSELQKKLGGTAP